MAHGVLECGLRLPGAAEPAQRCAMALPQLLTKLFEQSVTAGEISRSHGIRDQPRRLERTPATSSRTQRAQRAGLCARLAQQMTQKILESTLVADVVKASAERCRDVSESVGLKYDRDDAPLPIRILIEEIAQNPRFPDDAAADPARFGIHDSAPIWFGADHQREIALMYLALHPQRPALARRTGKKLVDECVDAVGSQTVAQF